jgi:hypothetical protein
MCTSANIIASVISQYKYILLDLTPATNSWPSGKHKVTFFKISHSMCGLITFKRIFPVSTYCIAAICSVPVAHSSMPAT